MVSCTEVGCRLCGSRSKKVLDLSPSPAAAQDFQEIPNRGAHLDVLVVYECEFCGHVFLNVEPVPYFRSVIRSTSVSIGMRKFRECQAKQLRESVVNAQPRVFEVGAYRGENLMVFKDAGFEAYGAEYVSGDSRCRQIGSAAVWDVSLDRPDYPECIPAEWFDVAISFNFLEHFERPLDGLKNVYQSLKPGGMALIEVPDFSYIRRAGLFTEFIIDHLNYFSHKSLSMALATAGFEILSIESIWDNYILSATVRKPDMPSWNIFSITKNGLLSDFNRFSEATASADYPRFIWGCGHQTMFMLINLGVEPLFDAIIDASDFKTGKYPAGIGLQVIAPSELEKIPMASILVCAGGFNKEILAKLESFSGQYDIWEVRDARIRR